MDGIYFIQNELDSSLLGNHFGNTEYENELIQLINESEFTDELKQHLFNVIKIKKLNLKIDLLYDKYKEPPKKKTNRKKKVVEE